MLRQQTASLKHSSPSLSRRSLIQSPRPCKERSMASRSPSKLVIIAQTILFVAILQSLSLIYLRRTFPTVPSRRRAILEALLIPLLPLTRHDGKFTLATFQRKWLYWPMTRARRLLLRISNRMKRVEPTVLYVNIIDGTYQHVSISNLPLKSSTNARYVAISDTHLLHGDMTLPPADVLIHCGDILVEDRGVAGFDGGTSSKILLNNFNEWLGHYRGMFKHRLVTGGNHDQILQDLDTDSRKSLLGNGNFVNDESIHLNFTNSSLKDQTHHIYASAASRGYKTGSNSAFQYISDEAAESVWVKVPPRIDILVTHGTPNGILDGTRSNEGCPILLQHVQTRIKPRVHIFGHWHDSPGSVKIEETVFINAASVDYDYAASHSPVVFDLMFDKA